MEQQHNNAYSLIIDIGKTHVKLVVLSQTEESVFSIQMKNAPLYGGDYPCADTTGIWEWLCESIRSITPKFYIVNMTITTHGATAALIDSSKSSSDGLVLPVLDYEFSKPYDDDFGYEAVRPDFSDTFSPSLPAGLNLARQFHWLLKHYPKQFASATDILMYPQYWAWRFTGQCVSEITSLGCHTDLWSLKDNTYSSVVHTLGCRNKFPELKPAWEMVGVVKDGLAKELGLPAGCEFYSGLHDSNASFLRYRLLQNDAPFTVVSTGTWTILMSSQASLDNLDGEKDMLANIDVFGKPIACARFMGGREFETICAQADSWLGEQFNEAEIQAVIDANVYALPDFSSGSGPFGGRKGRFVGPVDKTSGISLATLYCALMIDYQLDKLDSTGDVFIEGAFLKNPLLCGIVNQLRSNQSIYLSGDNTGTVLGAAYLTKWDNASPNIQLKPVPKTRVNDLERYKRVWRELVSSDCC